MSVLFGHPTGNPNSHHAALAHYEAGVLEAFCVPWIPSRRTLRVLGRIPGLRSSVGRLARRRFEPLDGAPLVQGRIGELRRLALRTFGHNTEQLSYDANDWLMQAMRDACVRPNVRAVHSYEDCSLLPFIEARRRGQACIYDMPIGCYDAWLAVERQLAARYGEWIPSGGLPSSRFARPDQKRREMELADIVLSPSSFVDRTIGEHHPGKQIVRATYGVDTDFWTPGVVERRDRPLRFIAAGQLSLRKGTPLLLDAWKAAAVRDAELELVGLWRLADARRRDLASNVRVAPPCAPHELRAYYRQSDVFVFPSFFEGFGLVLLEAMACGLPAIASEATGATDVLDARCGRVTSAGDLDALVHELRWMGEHRDEIGDLGRAARARAQRFTWAAYRHQVTNAVRQFA